MNKKVLIIEDDKNLAESLKNIFVQKNMNVKVSASAGEAEQFITLEKYDLLIVDVILPKTSGIDFLKHIIPKGLLHSRCKIWIISGVLNRRIISRNMVGHVDSFLEKPLNLNVIEKKVQTLFSTTAGALPKNVPFFYLNTEGKKNSLAKEKYIIRGHELLFICFYFCSIRFNGLLKVTYQDVEQQEEILFKDGRVSGFKSIDKKSYLGILLVKHNLVSQEDINRLSKEKSDVPIGERLVAGCFISPHHLYKILKEQLAIKLFEVMEHPLITVDCVDFIPSIRFKHFVCLEYKDLLCLLPNWIKSKVDKQWLERFFSNYKDMHLQPLKKPTGAKQHSQYPGLEFLSSPSIKEGSSVADTLKEIEESKSKTHQQAICELYSRLLIKESCLFYTKSDSSVHNMDYDFMKKKYETFIKDSKAKNYFELMNLPVNASIGDIETVYRNMVKIFHPDRRDTNMPPELAQICDKCFVLVSKVYQTLSNPEEKQTYLKMLEEQTRAGSITVRELYMKGKRNLDEGKYTTAIQQFESVLKNESAPGASVLYYVWSLIKSWDSKPSTQDKEKISDLLDSVGMEHKQSALYFFVRGLFMKAQGNKKSAFDCFTRALLIDPKMTVARMEKYSLTRSAKKQKKASFMDLFKKGA